MAVISQNGTLFRASRPSLTFADHWPGNRAFQHTMNHRSTNGFIQRTNEGTIELLRTLFLLMGWEYAVQGLA
jgi:hypothetical protein